LGRSSRRKVKNYKGEVRKGEKRPYSSGGGAMGRNTVFTAKSAQSSALQKQNNGEKKKEGEKKKLAQRRTGESPKEDI